MPTLRTHSNRHTAWMAVILSLSVVAGGCALWDNDRWDWNRYRDHRAVEIDERLERNEPIVKNPF